MAIAPRNTPQRVRPGVAAQVQYQVGARAVLEKLGLDLRFDTQQQADKHVKRRNHAAAVGSIGGAMLGGAIGGKMKGVGGLAAGSLIGGLAGGGMGHTAADVAHDVPYRTKAQYHDSMGRLGAAGGESVRIAAALPTATDFVEFAKNDDTGSANEPFVTNAEQEKLDREKPMGLGSDHSLEGGDVGSRVETMGLPKYDGV